ncbi:hypothetical protein [Stenotrophomonas oahuensis]|uniref:Uncharacterized protein n=1 Tax=Stenotrophomonas oahuensis TaxID=3003271 RepID=A0ABY9YVW9_9GAMM|nr:hypothetical protein [Stenotrophomonas sp. A5586]WNH54813.1 hypothetical protein PDM29_20935 [Stenotrophomonas sp. A5586]
MVELETISYSTGSLVPGRKRLGTLPKAELRLSRGEDGHWMWGVAYQAAGGFAFGMPPDPAAGRFVGDRAEALANAVADLRHGLQLAPERPPAALSAWLDSLLTRPQPSQLELFALDTLAHPNE